MKNLLIVTLFILSPLATWWFWGRQPYITMENYSDPILIYHNPVWYGWDSRGLKWITQNYISKQVRDDFPNEKGRWHVVYLTIPEKDLPQIDLENPDKTMHEWDKYYKWAPLGYKMPNNDALVDR